MIRIYRASAIAATLWVAATIVSIVGFRGLRWLNTREA